MEGDGMSRTATCLKSETGRLQKVIVHSPGREIQDMTPHTAEQLLYNDIIPLSVVSREHENFKKILQKVATVYEYSELLTDVLAEQQVKSSFIERITDVNSIPARRDELEDLSPAEITDVLITGLPQKKSNLEKYLSDDLYDINPLPNLYFTRDAAMMFGDRVISGCMANTVRQTEAEIAATVFSHHPELENSGFLLEGHRIASGHSPLADNQNRFSIEGGDFLVLSDNCLVIGCSERTSASAIDAVIAGLDHEVTVFAIILPHERATIHLDMILTQIDRHELMVYEPYICGAEKLRVVKIKTAPGREAVLTEVDDLLEALRGEGWDFKPVFCGNADPVQQQREQWLSGNNFFAIAPGKIIGYACNNYTMDALEKAGYEIKLDQDFLTGGDRIDSYEKLVIGISGVELARGGGGARCMTLPVLRAEV